MSLLLLRLKHDGGPPSNGRGSPGAPPPHHWAAAHTDSNGTGVSGNGGHHRITGSPGLTSFAIRPPPTSGGGRGGGRGSRGGGGGAPTSANSAAILAAAQAAGMPMSALDPSDPMSSMNALLAAAQVIIACCHLTINSLIYKYKNACSYKSVTSITSLFYIKQPPFSL